MAIMAKPRNQRNHNKETNQQEITNLSQEVKLDNPTKSTREAKPHPSQAQAR